MAANVQQIADQIAELSLSGSDAVTAADVDRLASAVDRLRARLDPGDLNDDVILEATPHRSG